MRRQKRVILDRLQQEYAQLKAQWGGDSQYDEWFARTVNNAKLNSVAAYYDLLPGFKRLLEMKGGDLGSFTKRWTSCAGAESERDQRLRALGGAAAGQ